ncbi:hypothetical protein JXA32_12790 [Candidatus Sumerlaeota bacterium]|nr:hypothetical protein [Candidatus Sumerlaeota bacterium]
MSEGERKTFLKKGENKPTTALRNSPPDFFALSRSPFQKLYDFSLNMRLRLCAGACS